jgi:hypothetical protein
VKIITDSDTVGLAHFCMMLLASYELANSERDITEDEIEEWLIDTIDSLKGIVANKLGRKLDLSA